MTKEDILKAIAQELRVMQDIAEPTLRLIHFTVKADRDGRVRAIEHGTEHHREIANL